MGPALDWINVAAKDVWKAVEPATQWAGENKDWLSPVASLAGSMYLQQQQQQAAERAQKQNLAQWQQTAFPNKAAMNAAATENRGQLAMARMGSQNNFFNELATRGFGSGSGLGKQGMANIERGYGQAYGNMLTGLTKFANTPQYGVPPSAFATPQMSPGGAAAQWGTGYLDQSRGYQDMMRLIQKLYGQQGQGQDQEPQRLGNPDYWG